MIKDIVAKTRKEQGLTLRAFGEIAGMTGAAIQQFEDGSAKPGTHTLEDWFVSPHSWLSNLAIEIYVERYRARMQRARGRLMRMVARARS